MSSFWRGVLTGSIIGGIIGAMFAPTVKPEVREQWAERGRGLRKRAERMVRRAADEMDEALNQ